MWWSGRAQQCLQIGAEELVWAERVRSWFIRRPDRCVTRKLESGLLALSPVEPNILNPTALHEQVRTLVAPARRRRTFGLRLRSSVPMPIVLLLPDVCVRTAVFELERMPRRAEEREALIRWRFSQEHLFPLSAAKVVYQRWVTPTAQRGDAGQTPTVTVLAAAIQESVLAQYEALCEACRLVPVAVTTAGLQLCHHWLERRAEGPAGDLAGDFLWVSLLDQTFSALAFRDGRLAFTRTKPLGGLDLLSPDDRASSLVKEVHTSLHLWNAAQPAAPRTTAAPRIVIAGTQADQQFIQCMREESQVSAEIVDWSFFAKGAWSKQFAHTPLAAMPAVAALC
ncbi:MAG: hypothetical protein U0172_01270 [Nitrospiraceae bacterium]